MWERFGLSVMRRMEPERAHDLAIRALRTGLLPLRGPVTSPRLEVELAGMTLPNPVGLAAGFDKNAEAIPALSRAGFGFLEVGAATPLPQGGNARPRLFRLSEDAAAINRFGFNNEGMDVIAERLAQAPRAVPLGLNLGANKTSPDRAADFSRVLERCAPYLDFATVNVSSPNTERLRELQGKAALGALLGGVMATNARLARPLAVFVKIAPDLSSAEIDDVAEVALETGVAGIIATNTTLSREGLRSRHRGEAGGLSGQPLFEASTRVLARLHHRTGGALPLIGVGGVSNVDQAWAKLRAGATAVQLYTALVYGGISLGARIAEGLDRRLAAEGATLREVTGSGVRDWL
jgi:dihydroorotate dehydrogenase